MTPIAGGYSYTLLRVGIAATVDNAMRSRVERFETFRDKPDQIFAYVGEGKRNGLGIDRIAGQSFPITVWTGEPLGMATKGATWRVNSCHGSTISQFYARINGREYTGRSYGPGNYIKLRACKSC
jgi:hypothetical protein